ncbi:MFS transporter [Thermocrinis minervae]|uniref:MFS transporter, UMF1 family n=1 Tax=Thermocrinis minervae TaxID=381751 RepID=A0A1M6SMI5_9AQUI|nr:MFS transporter [Thermocrinis minervae]SHK45860.1 MFS transporter, UMF1 family [Thermocrinis minervae]
MRKRLKVLSFSLFDFGQTVLSALIFSLVFPLYITKHVDVKVYSFFYGFTFFLSFLIALYLGYLAESKKLVKPFFMMSTFCVLLLGLFMYMAYPNHVYLLILYYLLAVANQQALVFYNSLLLSLENRGLASGLGVAFGYIGSAITLLFFSKSLKIPEVFLIPSVLFFLLSIPASFVIENPMDIKTLKVFEVVKDRSFMYFFLSFLCVSEIANLLTGMMGVYLREVYGLSDIEIYKVVGLSALGGVVGGMFWGMLSQRLSARSLYPISFILWTVFLTLLFLVPKHMLLPLGLFAGFSLSHLWAISRIYILEAFETSPVIRFSFYSLAERVSSTFGYITWSLLLLITGSFKLSALLMCVFPILGFLLYTKGSRT